MIVLIHERILHKKKNVYQYTIIDQMRVYERN